MKRILAITIALIMAFTGVFAGQDVAFAAEQTENTTTVEKKVTVAAVESVKAKLYSSNKVVVSWTKNSNADGYQVLKKSGDTYKVIKTIKSRSTTSYKVTGLKKGQTHRFAVRAYKVVDGKRVYSLRKVAAKYVPKRLTRNTEGFSGTTAGKLIKTAKGKLGSAYVSGASGPNAFDCSGYVYYICKKSNVSTKTVKRTSSSQMWSNLKKYSIGTTNLSKAQPGDIVFTASSGGNRISHRFLLWRW